MFYEMNTYKKDKNGNWKLQSRDIQKINGGYGHFVKAMELDKNENATAYVSHRDTRTGVSKVISQYRVYDNEDKTRKVVLDLITTSNKLPKKYVLNRNKFFRDRDSKYKK